MQLFSSWSERQAHGLRLVLLIGWLALIASLLGPPIDFDGHPGRMELCAPTGPCELYDNDGNRLFWGVVVPLGLLTIVAMSHEVWRRICPLAFVSQLFRAMGWQRTVVGKGGRRDVVKVSPDSWLGRHHIELQWTLFIAGLCLRLLVVNSSPLGLGLFLLITVLAAVLVGWAYGGKAWCHYVCPMGPVQTVLTGPRSLFGSPAHLGNGGRVTQSMCRTVGDQGKTQSACVACQVPCLDIDSERAYWQTLRGKRGLTWAWYSYPGLIVAFFLLIQWQGGGDVDYLRSGRWAYDGTLVQRIWTPLSEWTPAVSAPLLQPLQAPPPRPPELPPPAGRQQDGQTTSGRGWDRSGTHRSRSRTAQPGDSQLSGQRPRSLPSGPTHFTAKPTDNYGNSGQ